MVTRLWIQEENPERCGELMTRGQTARYEKRGSVEQGAADGRRFAPLLRRER
jgi:hypothetical protein